MVISTRGYWSHQHNIALFTFTSVIEFHIKLGSWFDIVVWAIGFRSFIDCHIIYWDQQVLSRFVVVVLSKVCIFGSVWICENSNPGIALFDQLLLLHSLIFFGSLRITSQRFNFLLSLWGLVKLVFACILRALRVSYVFKFLFDLILLFWCLACINKLLFLG